MYDMLTELNGDKKRKENNWERKKTAVNCFRVYSVRIVSSRSSILLVGITRTDNKQVSAVCTALAIYFVQLFVRVS